MIVTSDLEILLVFHQVLVVLTSLVSLGFQAYYYFTQGLVISFIYLIAGPLLYGNPWKLDNFLYGILWPFLLFLNAAIDLQMILSAAGLTDNDHIWT